MFTKANMFRVAGVQTDIRQRVVRNKRSVTVPHTLQEFVVAGRNILYVLPVVIAFNLLFSVATGFQEKSLDGLEQDIRLQEREAVMLNAELKELTAPENVLKRAGAEFGLVAAEKGQIKRIRLR